jgi:hypothetical protein
MQKPCQICVSFLFQHVIGLATLEALRCANFIGKSFWGVANAFGLGNTNKAFSALQYLLQSWDVSIQA